MIRSRRSRSAPAPAANTEDRGRGRLTGALIAAAVGGSISLLAYDGGAFGLASRTSVAIGVWWLILLGVALRLLPRGGVSGAAVVAATLLASFALLTLLSIAWSTSAERPFVEFNRVSLLLGVFLVGVLGGTRSNAASWSNGLALGVTGVALLALCVRLFQLRPDEGNLREFFDESALSYPIDYANGLAILVALAIPLLLRAAVAGESPALGAAALAAVPAIAATIYFTSSRGGSAAALLGTLAFCTLTSRRWAAVAATLTAAAGAAAVVVVLDARPELRDYPLSSAAKSQGESAAVLLALICVGVGAAYALGRPLVRRLPSPPRTLGWGLAAGLVAAAAIGLAASDLADRFESFKRSPLALTQTPERGVGSGLVSVNSTGRWQHWQAAVEEWREYPLLGHGAGSYEAWWAQHGSLPIFVTDAHSLYFEVLGELGIVGLALLLGTFAVVLLTGLAGIVSARGEHRSALAALVAAFLAFAFAAGFDWMWEVTVVSVVGIGCAGLIVSGSADPRTRDRTLAGPFLAGVPARLLVIALAAVVIGSQAVSLLSDAKIANSQAAAFEGRGSDALDAAIDAHEIQPWAASAYLQAALVQEQVGDVRSARVSIHRAIARDRSDWRLWLVAARLDVRTGKIRAARSKLEHARALNPRSGILARPARP